MNPNYHIADTTEIFSPALVFFKDIIQANIATAVEQVGDPAKLRPHVKTHKTREIAQMELAAGLTKQKCATLAEAEMLAGCGIRDVMLAYPMVGPNQARLAKLMKSFPEATFSTIVDHEKPIRSLSEVMEREGLTAPVMLDVDAGMHRSGIELGEEAAALYRLVHELPGLKAAGLHIYDGHHRNANVEEREKEIHEYFEQIMAFRKRLEEEGLPVEKLVVGGTPQFPVYAKVEGVECSPGTIFLHDGNTQGFPELEYTPAAVLLTRVISTPSRGRITLDLGYKAVASDPPLENRVKLLNVPDARLVLQNEEHLVVETPNADDFAPGDEVYAIPAHICPTCALQEFAYVVEDGHLVGEWKIASRARSLGC
ncbi:MAG: D-TA family PLP-dependent enzyme [Planctomycetota bacterium]|jgi:D-serine deaminase-like pyridoxal phosphate-dependent protein|nr:D-TA family PLP-dependent enzyme [Planctomycetota bacterium]MDP7253656.1 D-TA family PLP-dependent enzyme [Planctomycetota bacterium]